MTVKPSPASSPGVARTTNCVANPEAGATGSVSHAEPLLDVCPVVMSVSELAEEAVAVPVKLKLLKTEGSGASVSAGQAFCALAGADHAKQVMAAPTARVTAERLIVFMEPSSVAREVRGSANSVW
jgi:hypothetical protein